MALNIISRRDGKRRDEPAGNLPILKVILISWNGYCGVWASMCRHCFIVDVFRLMTNRLLTTQQLATSQVAYDKFGLLSQLAFQSQFEHSVVRFVCWFGKEKRILSKTLGLFTQSELCKTNFHKEIPFRRSVDNERFKPAHNSQCFELGFVNSKISNIKSSTVIIDDNAFIRHNSFRSQCFPFSLLRRQ